MALAWASSLDACAQTAAAPAASAAPPGQTAGVAGSGPASTDSAQVARGKRLFLRCASCHEAADASIAKTGPVLGGVVGRRVASVPGYAYSPALARLAFDWDAAHLDLWLERPSAVAPGTTMAFEGFASQADRQAVIAYLSTLRRAP